MARATWSACLTRVGFTLEGRGTHELGVTPAIDRRRSIWRRAYDAHFAAMTVGYGEQRRDGGSDRHRDAILMVEVGHGTIEQHDAARTRRTTQLDLDVTTYRYRYLGPELQLKVEALVVAGSGVKVGDDVRRLALRAARRRRRASDRRRRAGDGGAVGAVVAVAVRRAHAYGGGSAAVTRARCPSVSLRTRMQ